MRDCKETPVTVRPDGDSERIAQHRVVRNLADPRDFTVTPSREFGRHHAGDDGWST
jgi:hypothetical protein